MNLVYFIKLFISMSHNPFFNSSIVEEIENGSPQKGNAYEVDDGNSSHEENNQIENSNQRQATQDEAYNQRNDGSSEDIKSQENSMKQSSEENDLCENIKAKRKGCDFSDHPSCIDAMQQFSKEEEERVRSINSHCKIELAEQILSHTKEYIKNVKEVRKCQHQNIELTRKNVRLQVQIKEARKDSTLKEAKILSMQTEINHLKEKNSVYERDLKIKAGQIECLKSKRQEEKQSFTKEIEKLNEIIEQKKSEIYGLETEKAYRENYQLKISSLEASVADLKKKNGKLCQKMEEETKNLNEIKKIDAQFINGIIEKANRLGLNPKFETSSERLLEFFVLEINELRSINISLEESVKKYFIKSGGYLLTKLTSEQYLRETAENYEEKIAYHEQKYEIMESFLNRILRKLANNMELEFMFFHEVMREVQEKVDELREDLLNKHRIEQMSGEFRVEGEPVQARYYSEIQ